VDATVVWKEGLSFTGSADSGFEVPLGGDPDVGGEGDGFRPMELMAVSLAGCTAMDVISIMTKKRQQVAAFEVKVRAQRATEHPKVITEAVIEYCFTGHEIQEQAVRRSIELSAQRYCPAQAMLGQILPIHLDYAIFEGDATQDRDLVCKGRWKAEE
jgi:putative redox protein